MQVQYSPKRNDSPPIEIESKKGIFSYAIRSVKKLSPSNFTKLCLSLVHVLQDVIKSGTNKTINASKWIISQFTVSEFNNIEEIVEEDSVVLSFIHEDGKLRIEVEGAKKTKEKKPAEALPPQSTKTKGVLRKGNLRRPAVSKEPSKNDFVTADGAEFMRKRAEILEKRKRAAQYLAQVQDTVPSLTPAETTLPKPQFKQLIKPTEPPKEKEVAVAAVPPVAAVAATAATVATVAPIIKKPLSHDPFTTPPRAFIPTEDDDDDEEDMFTPPKVQGNRVSAGLPKSDSLIKVLLSTLADVRKYVRPTDDDNKKRSRKEEEKKSHNENKSDDKKENRIISVPLSPTTGLPVAPSLPKRTEKQSKVFIIKKGAPNQLLPEPPKESQSIFHTSWDQYTERSSLTEDANSSSEEFDDDSIWDDETDVLL